MRNVFIRICFLTAALALIVSCQYKPLCLDHPHPYINRNVKVEFDWSKAPGADHDIRWMDVWFFPKNGGEPYYFPRETYGGYVELPAGDYECLAYNGDFENITKEGTDFYNDFFLTSGKSLPPFYGQSIPGANNTDKTIFTPSDQKQFDSPDPIWSDHRERVHIDSDKSCVITFYPEPVTIDITIRIREVENVLFASLLTGYVSGLSCGYFPYPESWDNADMISSGEFTVTGPNEITLHTRAFAQLPGDDNDIPHILSLMATYAETKATEDQPYVFTWDITGQMHDPGQDPRDIYIELTGLELPGPVSGDSGLKPSVDDWSDTIIYL